MGDPFVDVMGPLRTLCERVDGVLAGAGLQMVRVAVTPGHIPDGPHEIQMVAVLGGDHPPPSDDGFDAVVTAARDVELDERATAALDELRRRLHEGGDFLGSPGDGDG